MRFKRQDLNLLKSVLEIMLLESLELHNWRNTRGRAVWGKNLNIIYGDNGQGKTNWLEAIYTLATTKSFRTQKLQEAIRFDDDLAVIRGQVQRSAEIHRELQITLQGATKTLTVNGKRESALRYLGQLHTIAFTADELEVVRGAPEARRRFLDRGVLSLHYAYVQTLADYNRVIKQKNRLLQDALNADWSMDELRERVLPWNQQLAKLSAEIHHARTDYVSRLNQFLQNDLFSRERTSVRYVSALESKGDLSDYEALITERLELRLTAEMNAGYSLIGTHRDDLEMLFDERHIRTFGSSGQQRSMLITLDLAALQVYYDWHREYPLFILDDVDAELDSRRVATLLEYLEKQTQTFITTSSFDLAQKYASRHSLFEVVGGAIK